jgi:hypothetical protein
VPTGGPIARFVRGARDGRIAVFLVSFAYFVAYPLTLGHPDENHLLYGAKRVLQGQVIYRDFVEIITPLAFYLFAAIFRIAGTTLLAARVTIAVIDAAGCALLFALVRRIASGAEAALAALVFAALCVPVWPYASAHWMSTTLVLAVATLLLGDRWHRSSRGRPFVAGMLSGIAICVQHQRGVFLAAWLPLAIAILALGRPRDGRWIAATKEIVWAVAGVAFAVLAVLGQAAWAASPALLRDALYGYVVQLYVPTFAGKMHWGTAFPFDVLAGNTWLWLVRWSPAVLLWEALLLARRRSSERTDLIRLGVLALAALMVLSVSYLADYIHVSFVLPLLFIPGAPTVHAIRTARATGARLVGTVAIGLCLVALVAKGADNLHRAYASAPGDPVRTAFGTVRAQPAAERFRQTVRRHLVREPGGETLLFVYPDDYYWLYLTLPADDAARFTVISAATWPPAFVDDVVRTIRAQRAGTILLPPALRGDAIGKAVEETYVLVETAEGYGIYVRPNDFPHS